MKPNLKSLFFPLDCLWFFVSSLKNSTLLQDPKVFSSIFFQEFLSYFSIYYELCWVLLNLFLLLYFILCPIIVFTALYYHCLLVSIAFIELVLPYGQRPTLVFSSVNISAHLRERMESVCWRLKMFSHKALRTVVIHLCNWGWAFYSAQSSFLFFFQTSFIEDIPENYLLEVDNSASLISRVV